MDGNITKDNWPTALEEALCAVLESAASCPIGSHEADALHAEALQLRELREMVRTRPPEKREPMSSVILGASTRDGLDSPQPVLEHVARVYRVYRLWRNHLIWPS
jgi:hypothetical protein